LIFIDIDRYWLIFRAKNQDERQRTKDERQKSDHYGYSLILGYWLIFIDTGRCFLIFVDIGILVDIGYNPRQESTKK
jgi:hypothetical protein